MVWAGGPDLLSAISGDLTPELAYVVLDRDEHLVMASDQQAYLEVAVSAATGDGDGADGLGEVTQAHCDAFLEQQSWSQATTGQPRRLGRTTTSNLTKVIQEYARHNGHADLLRESVDGQTGE